MKTPGAARLALCFVALLAAGPVLSACRSRPRPAARDASRARAGWVESTRAIYGRIPARVQLRLPERRAAEADALLGAAWAEFDRVGRVFNAFDHTSEVGRLNAAAAGTTPVSADLALVLRAARRVSDASSGAFDPTLWPIKRLWKDAAARGRPPAADEVKAALARTGFARLRLEDAPPRLVRSAPGVQLDFGGIAKGYAVDRVAALVRQGGAESGLVQVGGEICAFGSSDTGPWRIGVEHPTDKGRLYGLVEHDGTIRLSTSGNYQQPLVIAGKTYYHIFDPRTGWPVDTRVQGITVAAFGDDVDNATLDAMATAAVVLGAERGAALVTSLGAEGLLIEGERGALRETVTPGFQSHWRKHRGDPH
jgi:FAD:protein FMN transferase